MATTYTCARCGARVSRAPDGHWVNDDEDVICRYGKPIGEYREHDPIAETDNGKTDVDELMESMNQIVRTDDLGTIGGYKSGEHTIALFYVSGNRQRTVYLGTGHWADEGTSGEYPWRVEGAGEWSDVVITGMYITESVRLLYTAYQTSVLMTTEGTGRG
jgi:hypothetical protein